MKKIFLMLATLLLVANAAVWHAFYIENRRGGYSGNADGEYGILTVAFLDIGQGDAIFIEAPNGNQVIVDGGPSAKILQELGTLMPWYDKTIDMIVITNPDKDHIAGFVDVLKRFDVSYILESGTENKSLVNEAVHELVDRKKVEKFIARRGMQIFLDSRPGAEVILTVLFPDKDVSKEKTNDGSIIMRLTYGETEVMLTGDAPSTVEKYLLSLENGGDATESPATDFSLESDILKVGHHGSKTSTVDEFVKTVQPKFAVILSGKENKYGHPTPEVLEILERNSVEVFRTDERGTVVMKSDGKEFFTPN